MSEGLLDRTCPQCGQPKHDGECVDFTIPRLMEFFESSYFTRGLTKSDRFALASDVLRVVYQEAGHE